MAKTVRYRVRIEKITSEIGPNREWKKVHDLQQFDPDKTPQYKYVENESEKVSTIDIFDQVIEDPAFDMKKVVCAVNNLNIELQKT